MSGKGLEGQVALVTGAAKRVGRSIALRLASEGADVVVNYLGSKAEAEELAQEIRAMGPRSVAIGGDVSKRQDVEKLFMAAENEFGRLDILVNNAGMIHREAAADHDLHAWKQVLQVNLTSAFRLCQLAGGKMLERQRGKIVNIASMMAFQGGIRIAAYTASKGGIAQLTKALANEWAARNVQVNAIAPGYFRTENTSALQQDETRNRQILERIPAGRWGDPEDLAGAAIFLASPASNYVTGTVLVVDGGWLAR